MNGCMNNCAKTIGQSDPGISFEYPYFIPLLKLPTLTK